MPSTVVGLDIGRTAVRAVEIKTGRRLPVVRRSGSVPLPAGAVESGAVKDPAAVTAALRTLWREARIGSRDVRLGVCSGSVLVRQIELDWMAPADLRRALRFQVADLLPVAVDDANLDHVHLGDHEVTDPETGETKRVVRILLVATARGAVDDIVRCVREAGLRPLSADLSPLALVRAADLSAQSIALPDPTGPEAGPGVSEAVIDVGADKISVAVHTDGVPRFVRVAAGLGGETFTRAVAESSGLDWDAAERAKLDQDDAQARVAVSSAIQRVVSDIRATLDYHASTDPDHRPVRAVVSGGGAAHQDFVALCSRQLGMPVHRLDPRTFVRLPDRSHGRRGATAQPAEADDAFGDLNVPIGLCLGATA